MRITCARCNKPVEAIGQDTTHRGIVITVRCHGAVDMMEVTLEEAEEMNAQRPPPQGYAFRTKAEWAAYLQTLRIHDMMQAAQRRNAKAQYA